MVNTNDTVAAWLSNTDAYVGATTPAQRRRSTAWLQQHSIDELHMPGAMRDLLLCARTLGDGRAPEESVVALLLPFARSGPQVAELGFSRMLVPNEALLLLMSPLWHTMQRIEILDRVYWPDAELPSVAFSRWLKPEPPNWAEINRAREQHPRRSPLVGPVNVRGPDWLRSLAALAEAARPGSTACWLLRAIGVVGAPALATAHANAVDLRAASLKRERDALRSHPDQDIVRMIEQFTD